MSVVGRARRGRVALAIAASVLSAGAVAAPALAATPPDGSSNYSFQKLVNQNDVTFNQLLGINDNGTIAGYFGSGMTGHPNKGYLLEQPFTSQGDYVNENYPHSFQTQVTGLDNDGITVGFWADKAGNNNGWYAIHRRHFTTANAPGSSKAKTRLDQLLGVNDAGIAVGFYNDANGNAHGYTYNIGRHRFGSVQVPGATSITATAINNLNDIAGFETEQSGDVVAFLRQSDGNLFTLNVPGSSMTQAFGVNDGDEVVGTYTVGTGSSAMTYGFVWAPGFGFQTVNDPNGVGSTTINGVNDRGQLVGFYTDANDNNNVDGLLATPTTPMP
jgi:hypothetical protein